MPYRDASAHFTNRACPYFPCHAGVAESEFNCLFCYCPLYALGAGCGGRFTYTTAGVKDCSACTLPHTAAGYEAILRRCPDVAALAENKELMP